MVHSESLDFKKINEKIVKYGFDDLQVDIYDDCYLYFDSLTELGKYLRVRDGNPVYTSPEYGSELKKIGKSHKKMEDIIRKNLKLFGM